MEPTRSGRGRLRLLVVDDNRDGADSLCALLVAVGACDAQAAYSPGDAIRKARACRPDAVLLDLEMPPDSGFDLAAALRRVFAADAPLLLAMTGNQALRSRAARDARFAAAMLKPLDLDDVLRRLRVVGRPRAAAGAGLSA